MLAQLEEKKKRAQQKLLGATNATGEDLQVTIEQANENSKKLLLITIPYCEFLKIDNFSEIDTYAHNGHFESFDIPFDVFDAGRYKKFCSQQSEGGRLNW